MVKKGWLYFSTLLFFTCGTTLGFFISSLQQQPQTYQTPQLPTTKRCPYQLINPLRCEPDIIQPQKEYVALRNKLLKYIDDEKKNGVITEAALYFRDLENGPAININDQIEFAPASLLKLPLMISYYKKAETDQGLLKKKLTVPENIQPMEQEIKPDNPALKGNSYTIDDLITILIKQSDNVSWQVLMEYLENKYPKDDFVVTLNDLGIVDPAINSNEQSITVQSYGSIFRLLYNSSYLNAQMSNKALTLLTQTDFSNGIVAGVPNTIQVAHKFGERENGSDQQLHDCGIVYYVPNPYIICVMTRGHSLSDLEPVIQTISQNIFEEVKNRNK